MAKVDVKVVLLGQQSVGKLDSMSTHQFISEVSKLDRKTYLHKVIGFSAVYDVTNVTP